MVNAMRRVRKYVASGDACWRNGAFAAAKAWWRKAGLNYANAHGLYEARERGIQRIRRR